MPNPKRKNIHVNVNANDINVAVDVKIPEKKKLNIFDAINANDMNGITNYVNAGGDINVKNKDGYTPLMLAIQNGWSAPDVKKILDYIPQVNLKLFAFNECPMDPKYGNTIDMAINHNNIELVKVLVSYAGTLSIGDEICRQSLSKQEANSEIFKTVSSHIMFKNYEEAAPILGRLLGTEQLDIADSILSQFNAIPKVHHGDLLYNAALHYKKESVVDLLLDKKYVDTSAIPKVMYKLALKDSQPMFEHILKKVTDTKPIIDYLSPLQDKIPAYGKYAELLGVKFNDDVGTIYINDVIDVPGKNDVKFNNNDPIHVDVNICNNNGMCIQVKVDAPQLPVLQHMEGIILA